MNVEELDLPQADVADDEEIVTGNNVFNGEVDALEEVRAGLDEEIVSGEVETGEDWHRAVKHLNARIGELEEEVARLAAIVNALADKS